MSTRENLGLVATMLHEELGDYRVDDEISKRQEALAPMLRELESLQGPDVQVVVQEFLEKYPYLSLYVNNDRIDADTDIADIESCLEVVRGQALDRVKAMQSRLDYYQTCRNLRNLLLDPVALDRISETLDGMLDSLLLPTYNGNTVEMRFVTKEIPCEFGKFQVVVHFMSGDAYVSPVGSREPRYDHRWHPAVDRCGRMMRRTTKSQEEWDDAIWGWDLIGIVRIVHERLMLNPTHADIPSYESSAWGFELSPWGLRG